MTRTAAARAVGDLVHLVCDTVGLWTPQVAVGQVVEPGQVIGVLEVLGGSERVTAGGEGAGRATAVTGARHHRHPVDHGAVLVAIDLNAGVTARGDVATVAVAAARGLVFVAPSSGRFYGRPGPGKPAFIAVGDVIRVGHTVCLLEVMKTFHRVTYGGAGLPDAARVVAVAIADDADVSPGDVILTLEPVEAP
jgi:biotin carboxyl carrier protein